MIIIVLIIVFAVIQLGGFPNIVRVSAHRCLNVATLFEQRQHILLTGDNRGFLTMLAGNLKKGLLIDEVGRDIFLADALVLIIINITDQTVLVRIGTGHQRCMSITSMRRIDCLAVQIISGVLQKLIETGILI